MVEIFKKDSEHGKQAASQAAAPQGDNVPPPELPLPTAQEESEASEESKTSADETAGQTEAVPDAAAEAGASVDQVSSEQELFPGDGPRVSLKKR